MKGLLDNPIWDKPAIYLKVYLYLKQTNESDFDKIMNAVNEHDGVSKNQLKGILKFISDVENGSVVVPVKGGKKKSRFADISSVQVNDPDLLEVIQQFMLHRRNQGKPLTHYALNLLQKKLIMLCGSDVDMMIMILKQSMTENWSGIFPLKGIHLEEYQKLKAKKEEGELKGVQITDADRERVRKLLDR